MALEGLKEWWAQKKIEFEMGMEAGKVRMKEKEEEKKAKKPNEQK